MAKSDKLTAETVKQFNKERDKAVLSFNIKKFRHFYAKWTLLGVYDEPLPKSDIVLMVSLCKMAYHSKAATIRDKIKAKRWLEDRGYSTSLD
jgi:hypothetical protein